MSCTCTQSAVQLWQAAMRYEGLWWVYPPSGFRSASSHPVPLRYSRTERSPTRWLFYLIRMLVVYFDRLYFAKLWSSLRIVVEVKSDRLGKKTCCFAIWLHLVSSYDHCSAITVCLSPACAVFSALQRSYSFFRDTYLFSRSWNCCSNSIEEDDDSFEFMVR